MGAEIGELLQRVIARAEKNGASGADAVGVDQVEGSVRVRMGEVDQIQQARERRLGIRVLFGQRQAITATGDLRPETLDRLVDDTCTIARLTAEDTSAGLPDPADCGAVHADRSDLYDPESEGFDLEKI